MKHILPILLGFLMLSSNANSQAYNALHFDGVDDHALCPLPPLFNAIGSNDFTIEMWVNNEVSQFSRLMYAQLDANNFVSVSLNPTNEVVFYLMENSLNHSVQSTEQVPVSEWTHIAVRWDALAVEAKIFINGTEVTYASGMFSSSTATDNTMTIGSRTDGAQTFSGKMDELAIWDVARTQCEIALNVYHSHAILMNVAALYGFNEGTASGSNTGVDTAYDYAGLHHGTLVGFALNGSTSNWVDSGVSLGGSNADQTEITQTGAILSLDIPADSYQWINCNTNSPIVGATSITFNPQLDDPNYSGATGGYYGVLFTQANCSDSSECQMYNTTALSQINPNDQFSVYPNPSNGIVYIEIPLDAEEIRVISLDGQQIHGSVSSGESTLKIDLSELKGLYLVQVKTRTALLTQKISILGN